MGKVIKFPGPARTEDRWTCVSIDRFCGLFQVLAWKGLPSAPSSRFMEVGYPSNLLAAANLADAKARELGGIPVYDWTSLDGQDDDGDAA